MDEIGDAVRAAARTLRERRVEHAVVLCGEGAVLLEKVAEPGSAYELEFSPEEVEIMLSSTRAVFVHNHPRGWTYEQDDARRAGASFSPEDIHLACAAGLDAIVAVTPSFTFVMEPPPFGWSLDTWPTIERTFQIEYAAESASRAHDVLPGKITREEYQANVLHWARARVAIALGLTYNRFEERRDVDYN